MAYCKDQYFDPYSFLLYINNLTKITNSENLKINFKIILFADDTILIVGNPNVSGLEQNLNWVFKKGD